MAVVSNRQTSTIIAQPSAESAPVVALQPSEQPRDVTTWKSHLLPDYGATRPARTRSPTPIPELQPQLIGTTIQPQTTGMSTSSEYTTRVVADLKTQLDEVQNLQPDLGIMRQLYAEFMKQTEESLGVLQQQTQMMKQLSTQKVDGARAYINTCKTRLDTRSSNVLTKMEKLQDTVEGIKGDVLKRDVSPEAHLLRQVKGDIDGALVELQSLRDHIQTVKPMWKKTWEEELQNIVEEQQFLQHQEGFLEDLFEDHKAVAEVFGHVEKVISLRGSSLRPPPTDESAGASA